MRPSTYNSDKMAASDRFSRFGEKRAVDSDTTSYDEYIEGVEPDEVSSLETPIDEDNLGFKLIQKMGWSSGKGLGKYLQGRLDPVPIEVKDDHMGLGRWTMELEQAQDATEKRKQMEAEKDLTEDLLQQYEEKAEKDRQLVETLTEMNKSFYCELCDRQYTKYSEWDNHINSYSHHHQQRLRDLKQYESGRRFGGHRNPDEAREKMRAAQMVARERALMNAKNARRRARGGFAPAFTPIGGESTNQNGSSMKNTASNDPQFKRVIDEESQAKIAAKKAKLSKFGLKFQSAGTLTSITDQLGSTTSTYRPPSIIQRLTGGSKEQEGNQATSGTSKDSDDRRISFGFQPPPKKTLAPISFQSKSEKSVKGDSSTSDEKAYSTVWNLPGDNKTGPRLEPITKGPPPLMSRQRELNMEKAFGGDSSDEEELKVAPVKRPTKFKFNLHK